jgi:hypothetical protein
LTNDLDFGITQNPDTKVYILVFNNIYYGYYCEVCGNKYEDESNKWCRLYQLNYLKINFTNWTSGNEKIDNLIQKNQLKIDEYNDTIIEWIPYNKFIEIKKIGKDGLATAIWKEGPLYYSKLNRKFKRRFNREVLLNYLYNSNNFLNEV